MKKKKRIAAEIYRFGRCNERYWEACNEVSLKIGRFLLSSDMLRFDGKVLERKKGCVTFDFIHFPIVAG